MGVLKYSPSSFWDITLGEITTAIEYFHKMDTAHQQQSWERARFVALVLLQPHTKKGKKLKPSDVCQFEWEKDVIKAQAETEHSEERIKHLAKYLHENSYLSF